MNISREARDRYLGREMRGQRAFHFQAEASLDRIFQNVLQRVSLQSHQSSRTTETSDETFYGN